MMISDPGCGGLGIDVCFGVAAYKCGAAAVICMSNILRLFVTIEGIG